MKYKILETPYHFDFIYRNVLEAVAGIKEMNLNELADIVYENTVKLFL